MYRTTQYVIYVTAYVSIYTLVLMAGDRSVFLYLYPVSLCSIYAMTKAKKNLLKTCTLHMHDIIIKHKWDKEKERSWRKVTDHHSLVIMNLCNLIVNIVRQQRSFIDQDHPITGQSSRQQPQQQQQQHRYKLELQTIHRFHHRFSKSRRKPLLGPSPGWKGLIF